MATIDRPLVAQVLPEPAAIDKVFDYLVPDELRREVRAGSPVRVELHGRRVGGWVLGLSEEVRPGVRLRPITKLRGIGPGEDLVELARWAAWRWAGRRSQFLAASSPPAVVGALPPPAPSPVAVVAPGRDPEAVVAAFGRAGEATVVRVAPGSDRFGLILTAIMAAHARASGDPNGLSPPSVLIVSPSVDEARRLAARLDRTGVPVAIVAGDRAPTALARQWARAAAGGRVVIGARAAAFAPAPGLALGIVLDEHDEAHQSERTPTWHARDVVVERCRRAGAPAMLLSPCPSLEALEHAALVAPSRRDERAGWPAVEIVDRRGEDPRVAASLISERLVEVMRSPGRVLCVLNRAGRARLLACRACSELARCERCGSSVAQLTAGELTCGRCGATRPQVCASCGATAFKVLRPGVSRLREELEAVAGEAVVEITAGAAPVAADELAGARLVVGTEAALHRVGRCDTVVFCDFDQELLAPRLRAGEQALALLARAARLVGGRSAPRPGRLVVQTRLPAHPVLRAALLADPAPFAREERHLRSTLELPPAVALASVSGPGAAELVDEVAGSAAGGVEALGPDGDRWLLRAAHHAVLCDALVGAPRPSGRVRIEVDPLRI